MDETDGESKPEEKRARRKPSICDRIKKYLHEESIKKLKRKLKKKERPIYPEDFGLLDIRVARILRADTNPYTTKSVYIQNVEVGEDITRLIVSELPSHYTVDELERRMVVILCNAKTDKKYGLKTEAWILCGNTGDKLELLKPPIECEEGDKITVEGYPQIPKVHKYPEPKKRVLRSIFQDIRVNSERIAVYKGIPLRVEGKDLITTDVVSNCPITDALKRTGFGNTPLITQ